MSNEWAAQSIWEGQRVVRADKKSIIGPQWHLDEAMDR